jgi:hypothetical protein
MITVGYLIISVMCFFALYYAFKLWRTHPNAITLFILIPLLFLWIDNFAIAVGRYVGEGPVMTAMTYLRFYWHWQTLPLLVIAVPLLAERAGFKWMGHKAVVGVFVLIALFFMYEDVPYIWQVNFQPACYGETLRMVISVPDGQVCPGTTPFEQKQPSPLPAISVNIMMMLLGVAFWIRDKWPWLTLGALFMFACAASGPMFPGAGWTQILGNFGEPIFNWAVIAAGFKYAGRPKPGSGIAETAPAAA